MPGPLCSLGNSRSRSKLLKYSWSCSSNTLRVCLTSLTSWHSTIGSLSDVSWYFLVILILYSVYGWSFNISKLESRSWQLAEKLMNWRGLTFASLMRSCRSSKVSWRCWLRVRGYFPTPEIFEPSVGKSIPSFDLSSPLLLP